MADGGPPSRPVGVRLVSAARAIDYGALAQANRDAQASSAASHHATTRPATSASPSGVMSDAEKRGLTARRAATPLDRGYHLSSPAALVCGRPGNASNGAAARPAARPPPIRSAGRSEFEMKKQYVAVVARCDQSKPYALGNLEVRAA